MLTGDIDCGRGLAKYCLSIFSIEIVQRVHYFCQKTLLPLWPYLKLPYQTQKNRLSLMKSQSKQKKPSKNMRVGSNMGGAHSHAQGSVHAMISTQKCCYPNHSLEIFFLKVSPNISSWGFVKVTPVHEFLLDTFPLLLTTLCHWISHFWLSTLERLADDFLYKLSDNNNN